MRDEGGFAKYEGINIMGSALEKGAMSDELGAPLEENNSCKKKSSTIKQL